MSTHSLYGIWELTYLDPLTAQPRVSFSIPFCEYQDKNVMDRTYIRFNEIFEAANCSIYESITGKNNNLWGMYINLILNYNSKRCKSNQWVLQSIEPENFTRKTSRCLEASDWCRRNNRISSHSNSMDTPSNGHSNFTGPCPVIRYVHLF